MGQIIAVHRSTTHSFSKATVPEVQLTAGLGIDGDSHQGARVMHRSRVAANPTKPNLRQVHLIHSELFSETATAGFELKAGDLGENLTTSGIDLLGLPTGALLRLGKDALIAITGLRNPCRQIDTFQDGLLGAVLEKRGNGEIIRKAGVMGVVVYGGIVSPGDAIDVSLPPGPHVKLAPV
jgi:MOSC domain-containing protein YiiM